MAVIVSKDQEQSKLQERIGADLRNRAQSSAAGAAPDFAEDSEYAKDLEKTGRFSWIWLVLIILAAISLVVIILI